MKNTKNPENKKAVFGAIAKQAANKILSGKKNLSAFFANKEGKLTRVNSSGTFSTGNISDFGFSQSKSAKHALQNRGFIFVGL